MLGATLSAPAAAVMAPLGDEEPDRRRAHLTGWMEGGGIKEIGGMGG